MLQTTEVDIPEIIAGEGGGDVKEKHKGPPLYPHDGHYFNLISTSKASDLKLFVFAL